MVHTALRTIGQTNEGVQMILARAKDILPRKGLGNHMPDEAMSAVDIIFAKNDNMDPMDTTDIEELIERVSISSSVVWYPNITIRGTSDYEAQGYDKIYVSGNKEG